MSGNSLLAALAQERKARQQSTPAVTHDHRHAIGSLTQVRTGGTSHSGTVVTHDHRNAIVNVTQVRTGGTPPAAAVPRETAPAAAIVAHDRDIYIGNTQVLSDGPVAIATATAGGRAYSSIRMSSTHGANILDLDALPRGDSKSAGQVHGPIHMVSTGTAGNVIGGRHEGSGPVASRVFSGIHMVSTGGHNIIGGRTSHRSGQAAPSEVKSGCCLPTSTGHSKVPWHTGIINGVTVMSNLPNTYLYGQVSYATPQQVHWWVFDTPAAVANPTFSNCRHFQATVPAKCVITDWVPLVKAPVVDDVPVPECRCTRTP